MALKLTVDSLDGIDDAIKGLYVEKDGKFSLPVEGIEDPERLKASLKEANKEAGDRRKQLDAWKKLNKTPEEMAALLEEIETRERKKAEDEGDHAKILKQLQDKWVKEKSDLEAELTAARSSERGAIIGNSVMGALTKEGATEEGIDLLPDRLATRIKFETKDGNRILKIMQADGETPMVGSGTDSLATIDDLVKEAKLKWPSLFKGSGQSGSGTRPVNGAGGTGIKRRSDLKTQQERVAFVEKFGNAAYIALPT